MWKISSRTAITVWDFLVCGAVLKPNWGAAGIPAVPKDFLGGLVLRVWRWSQCHVWGCREPRSVGICSRWLGLRNGFHIWRCCWISFQHPYFPRGSKLLFPPCPRNKIWPSKAPVNRFCGCFLNLAAIICVLNYLFTGLTSAHQAGIPAICWFI